MAKLEKTTFGVGQAAGDRSAETWRYQTRARPRRNKRRIGEILLQNKVLTSQDLDVALRRQSETRARLGDILITGAGVGRQDVARAAAAQIGIEFAELPTLKTATGVVDGRHLETYLKNGVFPIGAHESGLLYASIEPKSAYRAVAELSPGARLVMAEERALRARIIEALPDQIASRASTRRNDEASHRSGPAKWQKRSILTWIAATLVLAAFVPHIAFSGLIWFAAAVMALNGALWTGALIAAATSKDIDEPAAAPTGAPRLADFRRSPKVSLLIPLYREPEMADLLITELRRLDYPPELLDIKILLEANDAATLEAVTAAKPPGHFEVLIAPPGEPRTKPRALNFAMDFVEGEIIGIYDAEDRPPPDQIRRIVAQFATAPAEVACIQARLGYYNTFENWMTRFFEVEYASWFDVMLPGLRRMGLPIPLGGTSLFIRRGALEDVGGWDSHNVTEDADLGMMLARRGLRTALSQTLTEEEASSRAGQWIRQRSRWLKGYLATWTTHMRDPAGLFRDLGLWRFLGFNAVLLSAVLGYLFMPIMWALTFASGALDDTVSESLSALRMATVATLPVIALVAFIALRRRGVARIFPIVLSAPAYWFLGAIAAYLAVWELVFAPARWRKTEHGVSRIGRNGTQRAAHNASDATSNDKR